jgi:uncharacterized HAD superfamily protein
VTIKWLKSRKFPEKEVYLLGSHYKVDKAKELGCDVFIEDRCENALDLFSAGFKVLLIDCYYNRMPLPKGIIRVKNWDEIHGEIIKFYREK